MLERGVPGGGEDGQAAARGIGAGNAHARGLAGFADDGGLGKGFQKIAIFSPVQPSWRMWGSDGGRLWFGVSLFHEPYWNIERRL